MGIWGFEVLVAVWFGYEVVTALGGRCIQPLDRLFGGIPLGLFTFSWGVYVVSLRQLMMPVHACPVLIVMCLVAGYFRWRGAPALSAIRLSWVQIMTYVVGGGFLLFIMDESMLKNDVHVRGAAYGDLPFHLNMISAFAHGRNAYRRSIYDIESVWFSGERLAYPFHTNFVCSALIATGGAPLRVAILAPSMLMALSLLFGLCGVVNVMFERDAVTGLSVLLFINIGGLGFLRAFDPRTGYADYVHNWGGNRHEYWFHPLWHVLVPQRASLCGLPLCYWTLVCLIRGMEGGGTPLFFLAGLYVALTPLVHVHSFMSMAQFAIFYAVLHFKVQRIGQWAVFGVTANVLGLGQFVPFFPRVRHRRSDFMLWKPIWRDDHVNVKWAPVVLWWRGLGFVGAIALVLGLFLLDRRQLGIYAASLMVWGVTNVVRWQPWNLDNTKLFYGAWVPFAVGIAAEFVRRLWRRAKVLAVVVVVICCASSFLHTIDCLSSSPTIFDASDIEVGVWVAENTRRDAVFLTSDWHAHPAATIAGRSLYMGYGGWVHSHGLDYWGRTSNKSRLQGSPTDAEAFASRGIEYVISRHGELREFEARWQNGGIWRMVYEDNNYKIWRFARR